MQWTVSHTGANLERYAEQLVQLGSKAPRILSRALNHEGNKGRTEIRRSTAQVIGLPYGLMVRAIRSKASTPATLEYMLFAAGGRISLKYFKPKEGNGGVTTTQGFEADAFITSGRIGARYASSKLGGHVYRRTDLANRRWGTSIEKLKGPTIPDAMMEAEPMDRFRIITHRLSDRVGHEISKALQ